MNQADTTGGREVARGFFGSGTRTQLVYLVLSALATGGAWLCYNYALQGGPATRVASIDKLSVVLVALLSWMIFKESMGWLSVLSICLITAGTVLPVFAK